MISRDDFDRLERKLDMLLQILGASPGATRSPRQINAAADADVLEFVARRQRKKKGGN